MILKAANCLTCRMIRRFLLAFSTGAVLAWFMTGTVPFQTQDAGMMQGLMLVAVFFSLMSVLLRMRDMRARFRKRG